MNKIVSKMIFGAALLMLAACTQDEMPGDGNLLPEGKYPLEISAVTLDVESSSEPWGEKAPQTRVAESTDGMSSLLEANDIICAKPDGAEEAGTFRITDAQGNVEVTTPTYWTKTTENVTAWFPAEREVSLANQSEELAYVLKTVAENASYNNTINLAFQHQLAKVRVVLQGDQADQVTKIELWGYTSCTHEQGTISTDGAAEGWINTKSQTYSPDTECWEANVVPGQTISKIRLNGTTECPLTASVTPVKGALNTITMTVGNIEITGGETITEPGNYIIKGNVTQGVILKGNGINLTLDNVTINAKAPIKIESGTPVIKIKGTNSLTGQNNTPGIHLNGSNANVEIVGDDVESSKLTISVPDVLKINYAAPAIGSCGEYSSCGNIKISKVTLTASGNKGGIDYSAAIGCGAAFSASCGDIVIENSIITATANNKAAAIGFGVIYDGGSIKSITITKSKLNITVNGDGAGIGMGHKVDVKDPQTLGPVTIISDESESDFFSNFKVNGYKVGKYASSHQDQTWSGVTFNGERLADDNSNGYK